MIVVAPRISPPWASARKAFTLKALPFFPTPCSRDPGVLGCVCAGVSVSALPLWSTYPFVPGSMPLQMQFPQCERPRLPSEFSVRPPVTILIDFVLRVISTYRTSFSHENDTEVPTKCELYVLQNFTFCEGKFNTVRCLVLPMLIPRNVSFFLFAPRTAAIGKKVAHSLRYVS